MTVSSFFNTLVNLVDANYSRFTDRFGSHTMSKQALHELVEILSLYRPRRVIEFGAGMSSFVLSFYAQATRASVTSVTEAGEWHNALLGMCRGELEFVNFVTVYPDQATGWYNWPRTSDEASAKYDLVIVDGPGDTYSRASTAGMAAVAATLKPTSVLVVDDFVDKPSKLAFRAAFSSLAKSLLSPAQVELVTDAAHRKRATCFFIPDALIAEHAKVTSDDVVLVTQNALDVPATPIAVLHSSSLVDDQRDDNSITSPTFI